MAKSFKILQEQLHDKLSPEQRAENERQFQKMLAEINSQSDFEPDLVAWLRTQNDDIKHYVNDMVRGVMNVQQQALKSVL
ncbi:Uncharacterised protein [Moraxella lacunata]|uniref:Uncharacterized protein n=1 Tax=Moraxella lacunata TaxID=477 RepID=A0A378TU24_MORLA|nr:hypothetical protein [Moraxella lacunata]STZ64329.1 Uncharacterised protein [Moraxella lacunata]